MAAIGAIVGAATLTHHIVYAEVGIGRLCEEYARQLENIDRPATVVVPEDKTEHTFAFYKPRGV